MQIYREALRADPAIAAAKANWEATQEKAPQARAGLLPNVTATASGNLYNYDATIKSDPRQDINRNFNQYNAIVSASQPMFRYQNLVAVRPGEAAGRAGRLRPELARSRT